MTRPTFSDSEDDLGLSSESEVPRSPASSEGQRLDGAGDLPQQVDLRGYGKSIGVDIEIDRNFRWIVEEAFAASIPGNWMEYADSEGRVYFFNQVTEETSWFHPMDIVYREIVAFVKALQAEEPPASEARRQQAIQGHLLDVHERARVQLDGWSGPYSSDAGMYYYSEKNNASTWYSPIDEWQEELALRHRVLQRALLLDWPAEAFVSVSEADADQYAELPLLPLGLSRPSARGAAERPQSPASARSYCTARSGQSLTPRKASLSPRRTLTARTPRTPDASSQAALRAGAEAAAAEKARLCGSAERAGARSASSRSPARPRKPAQLSVVHGSPPTNSSTAANLGSPVRVTTSGRMGKLVAQDSSDLPYKVHFEDGVLPEADWFSKGAVEVLDTAASGENGTADGCSGELDAALLGSQSEAKAAPSGQEPEEQTALGSQDGDLEFSFGNTHKLELPKFGK